MTVLTAALNGNTFTMANIVVYDKIIVSPVRNSPSVAPFPSKINVTPPMPLLLPPSSPRYMTPPLSLPLPTEPPPLIAPPPSHYYLVAVKENDTVVEFHQNKRKEYLEGTKMKPVHFRQWGLKRIFGESSFTGSYISKNMTRLELFLEIFPRD